jgi:hypothetical protein
MSIDTQAIIKEYQKDASDTGSVDVQVALLTARIKHLTEHFQTHSDVVSSSTFGSMNEIECIAGVHLSIQEEVSMSSSCLTQGLLIAENAG